jgi:hypothetical protein
MGLRAFRSILRAIKRSPDVYPGHVVKGEASLSAPACTEVGLHVGEACSGGLCIKGQGGDRRSRSAPHVILQMLLVSKVLDVVQGHFSPVIDAAGGAPHVFRPEGEQLEATHRELGDPIALRIATRFPDNLAHLLDHVIINLTEGVEALNGLVIIASGRCSLREEKGS